MANKVFRTIDGKVVNNVLKHTLDYLTINPNTEIFIGTDSQNHGPITKYATVIAYKPGTRGVHYIFCIEKVDRIKDIFTRLFKETELSLEIANWFTEQIKLPITIDMDYNDEKLTESHKLIQSCRGWALSLNYKVNVKPGLMISTKAADYHCR